MAKSRNVWFYCVSKLRDERIWQQNVSIFAEGRARKIPGSLSVAPILFRQRLMDSERNHFALGDIFTGYLVFFALIHLH